MQSNLQPCDYAEGRSPTSNLQSPVPKSLFLLDPDVAFLNHGSFGATPRPVFARYQAWQRELERQPVEFLGRRFIDLMRDARAAPASSASSTARTRSGRFRWI